MNHRSMPTIRVRYNRRTTLRPLNQMNGDHLGQLRAPRFGEWSKNVCGHNASSTALLKRDVRVWYEEHGSSVERIRRKQEKTYKDMVRLFREKKRVLRAAYRHQAEESKQAWYRADKRQRETFRSDASSLFGTDSSFRLQTTDAAGASTAEGGRGGAKRDYISDVSISEDTGVVAKAVHGQDAGSLQTMVVERTNIHSPDMVRLIGRSEVKVRTVAVTVVPVPNAGQTLTPREKTLKCVEVRRHKPNPLTIERTSSNITKECTEKESLDTADSSDRVNAMQNVSVDSALTTLGRGSRTTAIKRTPSVHRGVSVTQVVSSKADKRTLRRSRTPNSSTKSGRITLQPPRSVSKLPPVRQGKSKATVNDDTTTSCLSTQREIVTDRNVVSLAKLIKLRRKEREVEKKRILDSETVPIYTKTRNGDVLATVLSFHRKEFNPPSEKERYFRYKMLRAQEEARRVQGDRVKAFLDKIRGDELTFEEQQQQQMDAEGDGTSPKPKVAPGSNGLGGGLAKMAAAFNAYAHARYDNDVPDDV